MEYLDVLDGKGNPTGERKSKPDVHRDGNWHKTVHIWIMNSKKELLIQRRSREKDSYPNMWDISVAGHVSAGETVAVSLVREVEEELGIKLKPVDFEYLFTATQKAVINNGTYINNEFIDAYLLRRDFDISKLKLQKEEVSEVKWMPYFELEKAIAGRPEEFVPHPGEYEKLFKELHKRYT